MVSRLNPLVYAQPGRELMGWKSLYVNPVADKVAEVVAEGKGGNRHDQGKSGDKGLEDNKSCVSAPTRSAG